MARTSRKAVPPAPAPSVDALDDLNLDDMFEGGDDSLFDGLDIDLDGMGELPGAMDENKKGTVITENLDAMPFDLLGAPEVGVPAPTPTSRRKTKRKTKTPPPLLEDESSDDVSPTKKRRRKTTSKKSKSKSKRKEEAPSPASSTTSSKSKSRTKTSKIMPPPMARASSGGLGMVAAAGQFGGRAQKRGSYGTTQKGAKTKSTSTSRTTAASPVRVKGNYAGAVANQIQKSASDAGQESTFCGISSSSTLFFPFMPSLPPEPSLPKKCHRLYPCFDKISTALSSQVNTNQATPLASSETENEALFKLILPEYDHQHPGASDPNSAQMLRRASLAAAIASARNAMSQIDRSKLISDLRSICALLKRQHDFVGQSVENMERWCRNNFSVEDHAEVFGSPAELARKKRSALVESFSGTLVLGKNLSGCGGKVLRIKIKCKGFKEAKMTVARIPGNTSRPTAGVGTSPKLEVSKKTASRKRKVSSSSADLQSDKQGDSVPTVDVVQSYFKLNPSQRRHQIADVVSVQAINIEKKYSEMVQAREVSLLRQDNELQKIAEDETHVVNTATLWEWVSKSSYFASYTEDDIKEILHSVWQPESKNRSFHRHDILPLRVMHQEHDKLDTETMEASPKLSDKPLFDRLQALLVDVGSDDEMDDSDDEYAEAWNRRGSVLPDTETQGSQTLGKDTDTPQDAVFDFSELSVDERAYIQLRSIGLLDTPFLPPPNSQFIEEESSIDEGKETNDDATEMDLVLREMHADLQVLQRVNNSRTALLQSQAIRNLSIGQQSKKTQDEQSQQIAKYFQLMKKQKESKRSSRPKAVKKDEDWVAW